MIEERSLSNRDIAAGTIIALLLGAAFTLFSSGMSLIVTFVPGLLFAWITLVALRVRRVRLPEGASFLPLFVVTLAVQFLHFAEEFVTGFPTRFPALFGGGPYPQGTFVAFNMIAYFVFATSAVLVFTRNIRLVLLPVLFFVIYGAIGNAISHSWWTAHSGSYFPGFFTAQLYWVLGPLALQRLIQNWRLTALIVFAEAVALVFLLVRFEVAH